MPNNLCLTKKIFVYKVTANNPNCQKNRPKLSAIFLLNKYKLYVYIKIDDDILFDNS